MSQPRKLGPPSARKLLVSKQYVANPQRDGAALPVMKKAASEFEVPSGTKMIMLFPEVIDRGQTQQFLLSVQRTPRSDFYCSQAVWNHKIGMLSRVSFFNTYLAESKELSPFQLKCFWRFRQEAWMIFAGESVAADRVAEAVS